MRARFDAASMHERNAKAFVYEVLTRRRGAIDYPLKSVSHPPLEQRMRRAAEALKPVAARLPSSGGREPFKALATLQEQLSPVFAHLYIETGVHMEGVRTAVCTRVNSEAPTTGCPWVSRQVSAVLLARQQAAPGVAWT